MLKDQWSFLAVVGAFALAALLIVYLDPAPNPRAPTCAANEASVRDLNGEPWCIQGRRP